MGRHDAQKELGPEGESTTDKESKINGSTTGSNEGMSADNRTSGICGKQLSTESLMAMENSGTNHNHSRLRHSTTIENSECDIAKGENKHDTSTQNTTGRSTEIITARIEPAETTTTTTATTTGHLVSVARNAMVTGPENNDDTGENKHESYTQYTIGRRMEITSAIFEHWEPADTSSTITKTNGDGNAVSTTNTYKQILLKTDTIEGQPTGTISQPDLRPAMATGKFSTSERGVDRDKLKPANTAERRGGFVGDHTKPPGRPPSSRTGAGSTAEAGAVWSVSRLQAAMGHEDREALREANKKGLAALALGEDGQPDILGALTQLLKPRDSDGGRTEAERKPRTIHTGAVADDGEREALHVVEPESENREEPREQIRQLARGNEMGEQVDFVAELQKLLKTRTEVNEKEVSITSGEQTRKPDGTAETEERDDSGGGFEKSLSLERQVVEIQDTEMAAAALGPTVKITRATSKWQAAVRGPRQRQDTAGADGRKNDRPEGLPQMNSGSTENGARLRAALWTLVEGSEDEECSVPGADSSPAPPEEEPVQEARPKPDIGNSMRQDGRQAAEGRQIRIMKRPAGTLKGERPAPVQDELANVTGTGMPRIVGGDRPIVGQSDAKETDRRTKTLKARMDFLQHELQASRDAERRREGLREVARGMGIEVAGEKLGSEEGRAHGAAATMGDAFMSESGGRGAEGERADSRGTVRRGWRKKEKKRRAVQLVRRTEWRHKVSKIGQDGPITLRVAKWHNTVDEVHNEESHKPAIYILGRQSSWTGLSGRLTDHIPVPGRRERRTQRRRQRRLRRRARKAKHATRTEQDSTREGLTDSAPRLEAGSRLDMLKDRSPVEWEVEEERVDTNRLVLVGTFRSRPIAVTIEDRDWEGEHALTGISAARRAVESALGRYVGRQSMRLGPLFLRWTRGGEILSRGSEPKEKIDLEQMCGLQFEATIGCRGGADSPSEHGTGGVQLPAAATGPPAEQVEYSRLTGEDYVALDRAIQSILNGSVGTGNNKAVRIARQLFSQVRMDRWAAVSELTPIPGVMTAARVLVLGEIARSNREALRPRCMLPWIAVKPLVAIRFCDVRPRLLGWTEGRIEEAQALVIDRALRIEGVTTAAGYEWESFKGNIKVDGDLTTPDAFWTVTALLPQGPHVQALLTGAAAFVDGSYAVPMPDGAFIEVTLDEPTTALLKAWAELLQLDWGLIRGLLQSAISRTFGGAACAVRITTSSYTPGKDGKKARVEHFEPGHKNSRFIIGIEAPHLLQAGRLGPRLTLQLGHPPAMPVQIQVPCPLVPRYALDAMRCVKEGFAVRYKSPSAGATTRDVVLGYVGPGVDLSQTAGHLPAGWLSEKMLNSSADRVWALQLLRGALIASVGAVSMQPIGRLKKGGDPVFLYVMFASVEAAARFCVAAETRTLPPTLTEMLKSFLDPAGTLVMYCAYVPPEALAKCQEKELVPLFKAGMTDAARINPDAHAA